MSDTYQTFAFGRNSDTTSGGLGAVIADVAVLVADGMSPTQGHVNTTNTDLIKITNALSGASNGVVIVVVDTTKCATVSALRAAFNNILAQAAGSMSP